MSRSQGLKKFGGTQPQIQFPTSPQFPVNISAATTTQMSQTSIQKMFQQLQSSINLQAMQVKQTMGEIKSSINVLRTKMCSEAIARAINTDGEHCYKY